jgi:hypothetical protein
MALLSKDAIMSVDDRDSVTVDVEEWGGEVVLCVPSAGDFDGWSSRHSDGDGKFSVTSTTRTELVAMCLVDADGKRMFSSKELEQLGSKSLAVIADLFDRCKELCGITEEDIEDTEKNS